MRLALPLLLLFGCKDNRADSADPGVDLLAFAIDQPGPYNVGLRIWEHTYNVLPGEPRTITVNVWYPTEDESGQAGAYLGTLPDDAVFADAAPADLGRPYPLHAHSHGHQGYGATSADLMRYYASHGWVAVAPDHIGNLLTDNPDDEPVGFNTWRPMDVIASVDALARLDTADPLSAVDTSRYVVSGHSRGVSTVWSVLGAKYETAMAAGYCSGCSAAQLDRFIDGSLRDKRAKVGIPMAGAYATSTFGDSGYRAVDEPVLAMTGTNDDVGQQAQWDLFHGIDFAWMEIEGGCHQTFALGGCGSLDKDQGYWLVNTYALAMGRVHLLGDTNDNNRDLLNGSQTLDPRVTVVRK